MLLSANCALLLLLLLLSRWFCASRWVGGGGCPSGCCVRSLLMLLLLWLSFRGFCGGNFDGCGNYATFFVVDNLRASFEEFQQSIHVEMVAILVE